MLKVTLLEFFTRGLPEAFIFMLAAYAFSKKVICIKRYIISSLLFVILVFTIRSLPIHYGVHAILNLFVFIIMAVNINKIDLVKSMRAGIVAIILEFLCEGLNVLMIEYIFKVDINYVFKEPIIKVLYGIPSMLIFAVIVIIYYIISSKGKELKVI